MFDADRHVVGRGQHDLADFRDPTPLLPAEEVAGGGGLLHPQHLQERVLAAAQQAQTADNLGGVTLNDVVAARVGVARRQHVLKLLECDAVLPQPVRVGVNLVPLDSAAEAYGVGDAGNPAELPRDGPVVDRFEVAQRVDIAAEGVLGADHDVLDDFGDGGCRGDLWDDTGGQVGLLQTHDHVLPRLGVIDVVVELVADVGQPEERLAASGLEPGQAGDGDLDGDGDLALDLLGASTGVLGDDLDDGRGGVRIGLHVNVGEGVRAHDDEGHG